ncbi:hypothetical protein GCM10029976_090890 [Kribbella albertanoniae]|uniref:Uncharacterized protein n=1 Tax=Kribbella albertanoniae TaxID=1266829 RepID=A0A4R4PJR2_9ACTN|nr:hypothetical protein [Kribbella albertanoniae]TDC22159.1 hypothetical protein E1261_31715 [Kribbella albertanoniae]
MSEAGDAWRKVIRNAAVLATAVLSRDWVDLRPQYILDDWWDDLENTATADVQDVATTARAQTVLWFIDLLLGHGLGVDMRAAVLLKNRPQLATTLYEAGPMHAAALMDSGMDPALAMRKGFDRLALAAGNHMDRVSKDELQRLMGQNYTVLQGYRREAKPDSCGFCRRLAARTNPKLTGSVIFNVTEKWAKPHPNCRCVLLPQPIYRARRTMARDELAQVRELKRDLQAQRDAALAALAERHDLAA